MSETQQVEGIYRYYRDHIGEPPMAFFRIRKKRFLYFYEWNAFEPDYEALSVLHDSLPLNSSVFSELQAIVSDACSYQDVRSNRFLAYGTVHDPNSVVLEELKHWCHTFRIQKDLSLSVAEIDKRLSYIRALRISELFKSTSWTRTDTETMVKVLYRTEQHLEKAKEKLTKEYQNDQLKLKLNTVADNLNALLGKFTYYLAFILRDTPNLSLKAGDFNGLQTEDRTTEHVRKTVSGNALSKLVRSPLVSQVSGTEVKLAGNDQKQIVLRDNHTDDNSYITVTPGKYALKEEKLRELKRKPPKTLGIEPVIFTNHEKAITNFLILHGLFYEMARVKLAVQTVSSLALLVGQIGLIKLASMVQVIITYYQFINHGIETEMKSLNLVVRQVVDDKTVFGRNTATEAWIASQKKAMDFVGSFNGDREATLSDLMQIKKLSMSDTESELKQEALMLVGSLLNQTQFMSRCLGVEDEKKDDTIFMFNKKQAQPQRFLLDQPQTHFFKPSDKKEMPYIPFVPRSRAGRGLKTVV